MRRTQGKARKKNAAQSQPRDWTQVRIIALGIVLVAAWAGLWARGFCLQVLRGPSLAVQARSQHWKQESVYGQRGEIFDQRGELLAKSVRVHSVFARPDQVRDPRAAAAALEDILPGTKRKWSKRLQAKGAFVWLQRQVSAQKAARIEAARLPGVYLTEEQRRFYPHGHLAGQLLGFVGVDNQGLEGVELAFDQYLSGEKRTFVVQRDASGHILFAPGQFGGDLSGRNLHLTLDARIQYAAEVALSRAVQKYKARHGTCLVVEVATGNILAWAQAPAFNPNAYQVSNPGRWRNRLALDEFEPGSTLKPLLVAAALNQGVVDPNSIFFCENGKWSFQGQVIGDTHDYAWLSVRRIIRYSSNIGAGKIGLELGARDYWQALQAVGLGRKTGLPVAAESSGILRAPQRWNDVDLVSASFGQGLSVTGLQLAQAYLCLCNKGLWQPLRLVDSPHRQRPAKRRVFSSTTARHVLRMLQDVVEEDGTGTQARIEGISVGGKTGTAQKASPNGGYGQEYVASFVGILPALDPKYLVLAVVDEPQTHHYGGVVAAPVVQEVGTELLTWPQIQQTARKDRQSRSLVRMGNEKSSPASGRQASLPRASGGIPDVRGLSLRRALEVLAKQGIMPRLEGQGVFVAKQKPAPSAGPERAEGNWTLWLSNTPGPEHQS